MGAQNSVTNGTDQPAMTQDSRGDMVVSYSSVKALEAEGRARIAELEEQLAESKRGLAQKEQELEKTQYLLSKLQSMVEEQAKEQDRICHMESIQKEQLSSSEDKVNKLLLAVAGERHRAEVAEQAREESAAQLEAEWKAKVEQLRSRLEEEERLRKAAEEAAAKGVQAAGALSLAADTSPTESSRMVGELQQQLSEEVQKRMEVQKRLLEKDMQVREVNAELARRPSIEAMPDSQKGLLSQAMSRVAEEEAKSREAEGKLMEQELQMQTLQQQLAEEVKSHMQVQRLVAEKERKAVEMQMAMEGDELSRQQALQTQVIEKTREACVLQQQLADELSKRQSVQYQLLEKERMVHNLHNQIMGIGQTNFEEPMGTTRQRAMSEDIYMNRGVASLMDMHTHSEEIELPVNMGKDDGSQSAGADSSDNEDFGRRRASRDQPVQRLPSWVAPGAEPRRRSRERAIRTPTGSIAVPASQSASHTPGAPHSMAPTPTGTEQVPVPVPASPWLNSYQPMVGSPVPVHHSGGSLRPDYFVRGCTEPIFHTAPAVQQQPQQPALQEKLGAQQKQQMAPPRGPGAQQKQQMAPPRGPAAPADARGATMRRSAYRGSTGGGYYVAANGGQGRGGVQHGGAAIRASGGGVPATEQVESKDKSQTRRIVLAARTFT